MELFMELIGKKCPKHPHIQIHKTTLGNTVTGKGINALIGIACFVLSGCAGTTDKVVPTGHDTYLIATHGTMGWSSAGAQKAKAFEDANDFCKSKGKEVETVSEHTTDSGFGKIASADIEFRCVAPK